MSKIVADLSTTLLFFEKGIKIASQMWIQYHLLTQLLLVMLDDVRKLQGR